MSEGRRRGRRVAKVRCVSRHVLTQIGLHSSRAAHGHCEPWKVSRVSVAPFALLGRVVGGLWQMHRGPERCQPRLDDKGISSQGTGASRDGSIFADVLADPGVMRDHGEVDFVGPNAKDNFLIGPRNHLAQGSAEFTAANKTCTHLLANGGVTAPAELESELVSPPKFSQSLRAHGTSSFPDPNLREGTLSLSLGGTGLARGSARPLAAQKACRELAPFGGN
jgi:hypothetical protein